MTALLLRSLDAPPPPWQSERPEVLLDHVLRLTAPNAGLMTGPGTNSYLVGTSETGYTVIDPGPADAIHVERLWRAAAYADGRGGHVRQIVCTHSHPDHAPGAALLQARCPYKPPIWGLPSAPTARPGSQFQPDRVLTDLQRLPVAGGSLQAWHTPGHAANHVCLLLEADGLLFSGDHILNGSTTVIDPPDGNMTHYLDALDRLLTLCTEQSVRFILPAHGHPIPQPGAAILALKAHRLQREAKVQAALQSLPDGTLDDWVALAYDDVPSGLWPVAKRSLLAHVERLRQA